MKLSILCIFIVFVIPHSALSESWLVKHDGTGDAPDLLSVMDSQASSRDY